MLTADRFTSIFKALDASPWNAATGRAGKRQIGVRRGVATQLYTPDERRRRDATPWTLVQGILAPVQFLVFVVSLGLVLNYLAYSWVELGQNLPEARRMLERAVELRPNDGNIADSLGWALFKLGDIPGAVRWLEKAVELESQSSVINDHLGDAYWAQGRRREALFQWRRALVLGPEGDEGPKIEGKIANGLAGQPVVETRR